MFGDGCQIYYKFIKYSICWCFVHRRRLSTDVCRPPTPCENWPHPNRSGARWGERLVSNETTILEQILMRIQCVWQRNLTARLNFNESTEIKILNPTKNHVFESLTLTQFHNFVAKAKFWYRYRIDLVELVLMTSLSTPNSSISISNRPFTNFDLPPCLSNFDCLAPDPLKSVWLRLLTRNVGPERKRRDDCEFCNNLVSSTTPNLCPTTTTANETAWLNYARNQW